MTDRTGLPLADLTPARVSESNLRAYEPADEDAVVALWSACGLTRPWNDPHRDIARKLTTQPELFLVVTGTGTDTGTETKRHSLLATAMIGYDGHRGWVSYLAVDPAHRGQGYARALMSEAERLLIERGCPKIMLMVRADNRSVIEFYEGLDYALDTTVVMGKRLIPDR
jgi:ribosomal protein S18 acetylase RimI-like enzyme